MVGAPAAARSATMQAIPGRERTRARSRTGLDIDTANFGASPGARSADNRGGSCLLARRHIRARRHHRSIPPEFRVGTQAFSTPGPTGSVTGTRERAGFQFGILHGRPNDLHDHPRSLVRRGRCAPTTIDRPCAGVAFVYIAPEDGPLKPIERPASGPKFWSRRSGRSFEDGFGARDRAISSGIRTRRPLPTPRFRI